MRVILCGCGTVGASVLQLLRSLQSDVSVELVLVRDAEKDRGEIVRGLKITDKVEEVLQHDAEVVVECMGGLITAKTIIENALSRGKFVVTANKALLHKHPELLNNDNLAYEASVCGSIPIIRTIQNLYTPIRGLRGVMNGTCNYILNRMETLSYKEALCEAQEKGYAEADPTADVEGYDALAKLSILGKLIIGPTFATPRWLGIVDVRKVDIEYARDFGRVIRHVCCFGRTGAYCMPALVPKGSSLDVPGAMNAVEIEADDILMKLSAPGAGGLPTANAVVSDLLAGPRAYRRSPGSIAVAESVEGRFFIRFTVRDCLGIVGEIGEACASQGINIRGIRQLEHLPSFVITTEETTLPAVEAMMKEISQKQWHASNFVAIML